MTSATRTSRQAWAIWLAAAGAYIVAVLQRTSLGVAGLDLRERYGASASILATFVVLQLLVYASLQVPVGLLVDRQGPRRLIVTGALLMAAGQVLLAVSHGIALVVVARVLVGAGDAMTFISVLRLVATWFPPRRVPVVTQATGIVGQLGQLLSAIPLVALLHGPGWTPAFLSAAALGLLAALLARIVVRDTPTGAVSTAASMTPRQMGADLRTAWRHPGTRLGLWTHFTVQFSSTVFALLWGFPFLVSGQGLAPARASVLLTTFVLTSMAAAPWLGVLVERHPLRRSWLVLGIIGSNVVVWTAVLLWPGRAPLWLLVLLVLSLALGGPGSMIGFDFARTFNPPNRIGTASGIVNVGGFLAALLTMFAVGVVLDFAHGQSGGGYDLHDFRLAFCVQYATWAVGVAGIVLTRRKVRAHLRREGVVVPPIREAIARRRRAG